MIKLPRLGYGCYALSGAYGNNLIEAEKNRILNQAFDLGIRFFDTANIYADSEKTLGLALKQHRHDIIISTKVSGKKLTKDYIINSCEQSLRNLNTDYIDLYQIHYDNCEISVNEIIETLKELKSIGKIKHIGIGHLPLSRIKEYLSDGDIDTVMAEVNVAMTNRYNELIPLLNDYKFGIIAFSVAARGLLTRRFNKECNYANNDIRRIDPMFQRARLNYGIKIANKLAQLGSLINKSATQIGIAWVMNKSGVVSSLIGPTKYEHLKENIELSTWKIDDSLSNEIDNFITQEEIILNKDIRKEIKQILELRDYENLYNDLIYMLEYCIENELLSADTGMKIFNQILISKNNQKELIVLKDKLKVEIYEKVNK